MLKVALNIGLTPIQCREIVYQGVPYLGVGRVIQFLNALNEELVKRGVTLPLPSQQTTTVEDRKEKDMQAIVEIVGENMKKYLQSGPPGLSNINRWLAADCFGDYYTRTGLDYRQREMLTFWFLTAQGGCEPQLIAHCKANMRLGNDRLFFIKVVSQLVPYLGYPRCLNALRCIEEASKEN